MKHHIHFEVLHHKQCICQHPRELIIWYNLIIFLWRISEEKVTFSSSLAWLLKWCEISEVVSVGRTNISSGKVTTSVKAAWTHRPRWGVYQTLETSQERQHFCIRQPFGKAFCPKCKLVTGGLLPQGLKLFLCFKYLFIYLAARGLNCSTRDHWSLLRHAGALVVACRTWFPSVYVLVSQSCPTLPGVKLRPSALGARSLNH